MRHHVHERLCLDLRELDERDPPGQKCEWQECDAEAVGARETPWGDLMVCRKHVDEPLFGKDER